MTLMLLACLLTACDDSTRLTDQNPILRPPPDVLLQGAADPVAIPQGGLTRAQVETLWREDRGTIVDWREAFEALQQFYANRDALLTSK